MSEERFVLFTCVWFDSSSLMAALFLGPSRMSPKSQRPNRGAKNMSSPTSRSMEVSAASPTGRRKNKQQI